MTIEIHKPLENIKIKGEHIKAVGIPEWRLSNEPTMVTIDIKYRYKSESLVKGQRQFPHKYQIAKSEILKGDKRIQGDKLFYIVPIEKMAELTARGENIIIKTEPKNTGGIPDKPCWNCHGTKFAKTTWGEYICIRCHPVPSNLCEEIIDITEKVKAKQ